VVVGDGVGMKDVITIGDDDVAGGVPHFAVAGLRVVTVDCGSLRSLLGRQRRSVRDVGKIRSLSV